MKALITLDNKKNLHIHDCRVFRWCWHYYWLRCIFQLFFFWTSIIADFPCGVNEHCTCATERFVEHCNKCQILVRSSVLLYEMSVVWHESFTRKQSLHICKFWIFFILNLPQIILSPPQKGICRLHICSHANYCNWLKKVSRNFQYVQWVSHSFFFRISEMFIHKYEYHDYLNIAQRFYSVGSNWVFWPLPFPYTKFKIWSSQANPLYCLIYLKYVTFIVSRSLFYSINKQVQRMCDTLKNVCVYRQR